jgi:phage tail sheath protein FI
MPEYLSPGVYVEEVDAGPKPIEGVSTSVTGAVGVTAFGPTTGKPLLITSFAEFTRNFGGFLADPDSGLYNKWALNADEGGRWWHFPLAVKGYFDNGGQQLYVKRVFSSKAIAANGTLGQGFAAMLNGDAANGSTVITLQHLIGLDKNTTLHIYDGHTNTEIGAGFGVASYDPTNGQVTLKTALGAALVAKRGDYAVIKPILTAAANNSLVFSAKSLGEWGNALRVRVRPMVARSMTILFDPNLPANNNNPPPTTVISTTNAAGPPPKTTVAVASIQGLANGDQVLVNGQVYTISNVTPGAAGPPPTDPTFDIAPPLAPGASWPAGTAVKRLRAASNPATPKKLNVRGGSSLYAGALVELDNGKEKDIANVASVAGDTVTFVKNLTKTYMEGNTLRLVEAEVDVNYNPGTGSTASETLANLRLFDDGSVSYVATYVNQQSAFVNVTAPGLSNNPLDDLAKFPITSSVGWQTLGGGDDKLDSLSVDDFVGVDGGSGARTGIQALEDITDISICAVPGIWSTTVQSALITHCESLRYRFAVLDPQDGLSIEKIQAFREPLDTKYAALYYPWIEVRDPSVQRNVQIAPSAHMAGIYARVDIERGVHKAPANEVILSINKIAQDVTKREQDVLNPKNINALRFFPGRGNRVWGARVVTSDSAWKYINVRRLFIFVEASIDYGTQWVVFEPNDEPLWARVRQTITNFLTTVWHNGALQGAKPDEAFFVKCDHTTMTQDDIDNGRLICVIGIAPVKPAEFVIFRIQQKTMDTKTQ